MVKKGIKGNIDKFNLLTQAWNKKLELKMSVFKGEKGDCCDLCGEDGAIEEACEVCGLDLCQSCLDGHSDAECLTMNGG